MAVIGSRANGTRVPKGGGFGPASEFPQNGFFNPDAPQPASERRDVTFLGHPMLPAAPEPAPGLGSSSGSGFEAGNLVDIGLPPLDARSDLFVKSTVDRFRREWFDTVAQDERALDPLAATGFAGGIKQRFGDFTAKTLAEMPDALRPHIAGGLERVGREIETRATDFEDVAGKVGVFNQTKQALDDISATTAHERFDAKRLLIEGQTRIQDAPLNEDSRAILSDYFLADLPIKAALSHIDDDPDDALAALKAARGGNGKANGDGRAKRGAGTDALASGGLADGADGDDGQFDPATFYAGIAPEVHSGLMAKARITSLRRSESARITTTKSLEQRIAANTVTSAQIEASVLGTDDKVRLQAQLVAARTEDTRNADAAERFVTNPLSFDPNNPADRATAGRGFRTLAGETDKPASASSVGKDGEAVDVIDLAGKFAFHSRFMPPSAIERLRRIVVEGASEDSKRAATMLDEFNIPLSEAAVPPSPSSPSQLPEDQPNTPPRTREETVPNSNPPAVSVDEERPGNLDPERGNTADRPDVDGAGDVQQTPQSHERSEQDERILAEFGVTKRDPENLRRETADTELAQWLKLLKAVNNGSRSVRSAYAGELRTQIAKEFADRPNTRSFLNRWLGDLINEQARLVDTNPQVLSPETVERTRASRESFDTAVDVFTDFIPIIDDVKAGYRAFKASLALDAAIASGDEQAVNAAAFELTLALTDVLPGPNLSRLFQRIGSRADRIPLLNTLKEKMQRLFNKAKGPDGADAKPVESSTARSDSGGGNPETSQPEPPEGRRDANPEQRRSGEAYNRYLDTEPVPGQTHPVLSGRSILQPGRNAEELLKRATEAKPAFDKGIAQLAKSIGDTEFQLGPIKDKGRLGEKIQDLRDEIADETNIKISAGGAELIGDYVRAAFVPKTPDAFNRVLQSIRRQYKVIGNPKDYIRKAKPNGYRAYHVQVLLPNGMTAEIIVRPSPFDAAAKKNREIFEKWRNHPQKTSAEEVQFRKDVRRSIEIWEQADEVWRKMDK